MKYLSVATLLLVASASIASANVCVGLWIERNSIFDQAGYCFGSALGTGYFDNSDCYTKSPNLSRSDNNRVADIQLRETALGCAQQKESWSLATLRNYGSGSFEIEQTQPYSCSDYRNSANAIWQKAHRLHNEFVTNRRERLISAAVSDNFCAGLIALHTDYSNGALFEALKAYDMLLMAEENNACSASNATIMRSNRSELDDMLRQNFWPLYNSLLDLATDINCQNSGRIRADRFNQTDHH